MVKLSDFEIKKTEPILIKIDDKEIRVKTKLPMDEYWLMINDIITYACKPMKVDPIKLSIAADFYIIQYYTSCTIGMYF